MVEDRSTTSRRALLSALAMSPAALVVPSESKIMAFRFPPPDTSFRLERSREGRSLSRFRYCNAEGFFASTERGAASAGPVRLYQIGIVLQLGLSSHLLDVGFDDQWCARHISLDVGKSLAYANATGLGHNVAELEYLAKLLSPYWKWRNTDATARSSRIPFSDAQIIQHTRDLLDRVRTVTGHPRPRGWHADRVDIAEARREVERDGT